MSFYEGQLWTIFELKRYIAAANMYADINFEEEQGIRVTIRYGFVFVVFQQDEKVPLLHPGRMKTGAVFNQQYDAIPFCC